MENPFDRSWVQHLMLYLGVVAYLAIWMMLYQFVFDERYVRSGSDEG